MAFIVTAAATAAASAVAGVAGGVTVAGALGAATGIGAATAPLAAAGLSAGLGAGAAAAGIGAGAATAGALGAGIGAIGAAATGGDVGKGALSGAVSGAVTGGIAPGLGGITAGLGSTVGGAVTGGVAGAAGSAAGAGAVGEDAGQAALMGGGIGALGGAIGGAMDTPTVDKGAMTGVEGAPPTGVDGLPPSGPQGNYPQSPFARGAPTMELPNSSTAALSPTANSLVGAPTSSGLGGQLADNLGNASSAYGQQIVSNPIGIAQSALPDLATGAYYGGGLDTQYPTEQPTVTQDIGGSPLADTYQRTGDPARKKLPKYYATGGGIGSIPNAGTPKPKPLLNETTPPAQPQTMNKFAGMGFEAAKIGQEYVAQQQQPQQPQVGIPRPMQPTPPPTPTFSQPSAQPNQPMFYAAGGAVQGTGQASGTDMFNQQVRALAAQKVKEHYAQQARDLQAQQQQQYLQQRSQVINTSNDGRGNSVSNIQPSYANGGVARDNLGGYSHGGIAGLTRAVGSGVSDEIPAQIGTSGRQPARLAANEFVIPARAVSELGQGSSEAGAKQLQAMVDRIQAGRKKSIGKGKIAVDSKAIKHLPA